MEAKGAASGSSLVWRAFHEKQWRLLSETADGEACTD